MHPFRDRTDPNARRVVIMGCGRIGASIATAMSEEGFVVHVLDPDAAALDLLPLGKVEDGHIVPILGDGTLEEDLRKADTQDADIFIAVTDKDTRNALAAQMAQHLLRVPKVICQMNDPTNQEMYTQLGVMTVSATVLVTASVLDATGS